MRFDLLVNAMYKNARLNGKIIADNPKIARPLLAMEDAIEAYVCALEAPEELSGTYNIASANVTVGAVAQEIQKHFKRVHHIDIELEEQNVQDLRDYAANIDKAKKELSFTPHGSVASILKGLDEHYDASFDYANDKYYNIKVFKKIFEQVSQV